MTGIRLLSSLLRAWLLALLVVPAAAGLDPASEPAPRETGRVVVLGFDGADFDTTQELMDEGLLPNLARLREQGTYSGLRSTAPAESPTAWASLNTGQNPAKTNVLAFFRNTVTDDPENPSIGPAFGHVTQGSRPVTEFEEAPFLVSLMSKGPVAVAGLAFGGCLVVFLLVFSVLLRMSLLPAAVLSTILGVVGAWAGHRYAAYLPSEIPIWDNPNVARNFWDVAAEAGVESRVLDAAMSFNMPTVEGAKLLTGLGVPDARSGLGDWFIYTTDPFEFDRPPNGRGSSTAGTIFRVDERDGRIETQLYGPHNFWQAELDKQLADDIQEQLEAEGDSMGYKESFELQQQLRELQDRLGAGNKGERVPVDLVVEKSGASADVTIGTETQTLVEGEWSEFYHLTFDLNPLLKVNAITRVKIVTMGDGADVPFELFVNTLDIDPADPIWWQPIAHPLDFASELADRSGPYETYGWPSLTMPYKDEEVSFETMIEDLEFTMKWREEVFHDAFDVGDWRLFFGVFSITDRVQHMSYAFHDPQHPMHDPVEAAKTLEFFGETIPRSEVIRSVYRQMDRIVGDFMEKLEDDDVLLLCADHGFESFRHQVHLNNWLYHNGFQTAKPSLQRSDSGGFQYLDWSQTQAYSLGLGFIYLNRVGREPEGIVTDEEAPAILAQIKERLLATQDPDNPGVPVVQDAYLIGEEHDGPFLHREADMVVGFAPNYRISWASGTGGVNLDKDENDDYVVGTIFKDNDKNWSGGHVSVDLDRVQGIFFCNRQVDLPEEGANLLHMAPTVLDLLGVGIPEEMDMSPLAIGG